MRQRLASHHRAPPIWVGVLVALLFVMLMAAVRLGLVPNVVLPIGYGVPIVVIAYFRNRPLLWMAFAAFTVITIIKFFGGSPSAIGAGPPLGRAWEMVMIELDLLLVTAMGQFWMSLQDAADARNAELEAANLHKTRFLAAVSHDVRTPANAISLLADLMRRTAAKPGQTEEISEISQELYASAAALVTLLNDVLDIARFDSGGMGMQISEFSLAQMMDDERGRLAPLAREKNLAYRWVLPAGEIRLRTDCVKLCRVLGNLVGNALKFTDRGEVRVEAARTAQGGVELRVIDTGTGIAPEHQRDIFNEFFQLRNPERDRNKGSGLGLSICKRLVDAMGASLSVQSALGQGSTFTVTLPPDSVIDRPPQAAGDGRGGQT